MGKKKKEKAGGRNTSLKTPAKGKEQEMTLESFLAATVEELLLAINELPDGIMLEVYFNDES